MTFALFGLQCNRRKALDAFFGEALDSDPINIALLGCGCSIATKAVAEVIHYWKLSQVCKAHSDCAQFQLLCQSVNNLRLELAGN